MAVSALSLPIDIPWRRLATTDDMFAPSLHKPLPVKWQPSIAVFYYEPEPSEDLDKIGERTVFLKIVATFTGFQPEGAEIDERILGALLESNGALVGTVIERFEEESRKYYPAYSGLVHVGVFPSSGDWQVHQFPYFADFEPKKREVVELVSTTGEALTQSGTYLNVRKGTTSVDRTEIADIDRGGSFGINAALGVGQGMGASFGMQSSHQQEVGTRNALGTEAMSVVTTDRSQEKRETYSHTTTLAQLYHELNSYHMGTNRALFFVNARPHFVDVPSTFVNGPRRLEGIQEFFLVVQCPRRMEHLCVKAVVETAHLDLTEFEETTGETLYERSSVIKPIALRADGSSWHDGEERSGRWTVPIPSGFKIDRTRGGGTIRYEWRHTDGRVYLRRTYRVPDGVKLEIEQLQTKVGTEDLAFPEITAYDDHVDLKATIHGWYETGADSSGRLRITVTVFIISEQPVEEPTTSVKETVDLFVIGREVAGCTGSSTKRPTAPYVIYEHPMPRLTHPLRASRGSGTKAIEAANEVSRAVGQALLESHSTDRRYETHSVDFFHTRISLRKLRLGLDRVAPELLDKRVIALPDLPQAEREHLERADPPLSVGELVRSTPETLAGRLKISPTASRRLMAALLGVRYGASHPTPGDAGRGRGQGGRLEVKSDASSE